MTTQEMEIRISALEQELVKLRGKPVVYASNIYSVASQNCKAYFESVKGEGQDYGARMLCEKAARDAFKERHSITGRDVPSRYILTEEDAKEYFELFKEFLSVYQNYMQKNPV